MLTRGPTGRAGLGHRVLPRALARAAHDEQVAVPEPERPAGATAARPQQQRAGGAERHDRDEGVLAGAAPDRVAVPGHGVAAVAVEAAAGRRERLAELGPVEGGERRPGVGEHRVGEGVAGVVPGDRGAGRRRRGRTSGGARRATGCRRAGRRARSRSPRSSPARWSIQAPCSSQVRAHLPVSAPSRTSSARSSSEACSSESHAARLARDRTVCYERRVSRVSTLPSGRRATHCAGDDDAGGRLRRHRAQGSRARRVRHAARQAGAGADAVPAADRPVPRRRSPTSPRRLPPADRATVGMPGMIRHGVVISTPHYVTESGPRSQAGARAGGAVDRLRRARGAGPSGSGMPTLVLNDAEVHGAGVVIGARARAGAHPRAPGLGCALFDGGRARAAPRAVAGAGALGARPTTPTSGTRSAAPRSGLLVAPGPPGGRRPASRLRVGPSLPRGRQRPGAHARMSWPTWATTS